MRGVVLMLLFVLVILNVGNVGVDEERIAFECALEEQNFLFFEVDRF